MPIDVANTLDASNGMFKDLFISANKRTGLTRIGVYDQGYETFNVEELRELRSYIGKLLIKLQFEKK